MTDREKLIELLETVVSPNEVLCDGEVLVSTARVADHLIANGVTVQKWISVTERLPDLELTEAKQEDADVYPCLATIKHRMARGGRYVSKVWYDGELFTNGDCFDLTDEVTHWMPLPEPPKGE